MRACVGVRSCGCYACVRACGVRVRACSPVPGQPFAIVYTYTLSCTHSKCIRIGSPALVCRNHTDKRAHTRTCIYAPTHGRARAQTHPQHTCTPTHPHPHPPTHTHTHTTPKREVGLPGRVAGSLAAAKCSSSSSSSSSTRTRRTALGGGRGAPLQGRSATAKATVGLGLGFSPRPS